MEVVNYIDIAIKVIISIIVFAGFFVTVFSILAKILVPDDEISFNNTFKLIQFFAIIITSISIAALSIRLMVMVFIK